MTRHTHLKTTIFTMAFAVSLVLLLIIPSVSAYADYAPDRVIIKYLAPDGSNNTSALTDGMIHAEILSDHSGFVPGLYTLKLPLMVSVPKAIAYYRNITGVEYVEPDYYTSAVIETPLPATTSQPVQTTPSAPVQTSTPAGFVGMLAGLIGAAVVILRK